MSRARWTVVSLEVVAVLGVIGLMTAGLRSAAALRSTRTATAGGEGWPAHLAAVDRALESADIAEAVRAWRDGYGQALGSRRWEPMFAIGHAALRIGRAAGTRKGYDEKARQCYLMALFRARQQRSAEGASLVAEAFADLGDVEVASRAARVAERLGRGSASSASPRDVAVEPAGAAARPDHRPATPPRRRELGATP
jgi:hypothetical protein